MSLSARSNADIEAEGMATVSDEEINAIVDLLEKTDKNFKINVGRVTMNTDTAIAKLRARDPDVFLLVEIYRADQQSQLAESRAEFLQKLGDEPNQDEPLLLSKDVQYSAKQMAEHVRNRTPEGAGFLKTYHDEMMARKKLKAKEKKDAQGKIDDADATELIDVLMNIPSLNRDQMNILTNAGGMSVNQLIAHIDERTPVGLERIRNHREVKERQRKIEAEKAQRGLSGAMKIVKGLIGRVMNRL